ncbi:MAG: hypothetical protein HY288_06730 [Planctomycetia bacterium]|nr:hypothetical protein [Planctomycetia bacterium]
MKRFLIQWAIWLCACEAALGSTPDDPSKSAHSPRGQDAKVEWEILFEEGITAEEYAKQLDYFKIEVGAISKKGKIEYISKVANPKPERRIGQKTTDYRMSIGWKTGTLHAADRKLLAKAGINSEGKELWHFFPTEVQVQLGALQRSYAKRDPSEIKRTRFQIRPKEQGGGYEFVVVEQDPPKPTDSQSKEASLNTPGES